jgi:hypothetical protein
MDNIVLSWLFGTLAVEIDIVRERGGTTQQDMVVGTGDTTMGGLTGVVADLSDADVADPMSPATDPGVAHPPLAMVGLTSAATAQDDMAVVHFALVVVKFATVGG